MNALKAPFYALYDLAFYRRAQQKEMGPGFLHLLILAAILSLVIISVLVTKGLPQANDFVDWVKSDMPSLTWTPEGLVMNEQSPYLMIHPDFGVMATFDPTVRDVGAEHMADTLIFVTATKAYLREGENLVRVIDLTRPVGGTDLDSLVVAVNPDLVDRLYKTMRPWLIVLIAVVMVPLFFLGNIVLAFFYSLAAQIFNGWRMQRLPYKPLFTISCYAMTGSVLLSSLSFMMPRIGEFTLGFLGDLFLTIFYLYLGLIRAEGDAGGETPPA